VGLAARIGPSLVYRRRAVSFWRDHMAPLLFRNRFRVPSARLRGWDYRWPGVYAVTICDPGAVKFVSGPRASK